MSRSSRRGKSVLGSLIATLIFGPGFIAIGIFVLFWIGFPNLKEAKESKEWPSVTGKIIKSEVNGHRNDEGQLMYSPLVEYQYEVDGKQYENGIISFSDGWSTSSKKKPKEVAAQFPVGSSAPVYYSPDDPDECVLIPGPTWINYILLGSGFIFLIIGLCVTGFIVVYFVVGAAAIGGAVSGMIGKKSGSTTQSASTPPTREPSNSPDPNFDDDAFDIN